MRLLLDTCALLWFLSKDLSLSQAAKTAIEDPANIRWVSPISLFEIAIKVCLGKLPLAAPFSAIFPTELAPNDFPLLPLNPQPTDPMTRLPQHHKDPFDRLIAATALVEGLTLVSADSAFDAYGV